MSLPNDGWSNKQGTKDRACACGTWQKHWENLSGQHWPSECVVSGCAEPATVGGHVVNPGATGERIVPLCDGHNKVTGKFSLKGNVQCVSANKAETCEKLKP